MNPSDPPPSIPPTNPTPPPSAPYGAPPSVVPPGGGRSGARPGGGLSPLLGVVIAAVVAVGVFGGLRALRSAAPSGVTTNGKALSNDEARAGVKEMVELMRGARAGDPSSINTSFEPKTELGKNFKAVIVKSQGVEAEYAKALGDGTVADLIDAKSLTSAPARAAAHEKLDALRVASKKYFADTATVTADLFRVISGANGQRVPQAASLEAEVAANSAAMTTLLDTAGEILDFADEAKPEMQGSIAAFRTDAQVSRFNTLIEKYNTNAKNLETTAANALRDRQRKMSEAMQKVDSGAL